MVVEDKTVDYRSRLGVSFVRFIADLFDHDELYSKSNQWSCRIINRLVLYTIYSVSICNLCVFFWPLNATHWELNTVTAYEGVYHV